jgi:hypothetical protein
VDANLEEFLEERVLKVASEATEVIFEEELPSEFATGAPIEEAETSEIAPEALYAPIEASGEAEAEEPSSSTVEVPSAAWKEDLPSVSAEEPAIAEAAVEEHSQEVDNHGEISGKQSVEDEIQPKEPGVEVVEKEAETTHSIEPVAELVAGEPASGKEEESTIPAEVSGSTGKKANPAEEGHEPPIVANAGAVTPVEEPRVEGDVASGADGRELPTAVE